MEHEVVTTTSQRIFLSVPVPARARQTLEGVLGSYNRSIEKVVSPEKWHLTLFHLGDVQEAERFSEAFASAIPLIYVPTIQITHIGRGRNPQQLWAFVHTSPGLLNVHKRVHEMLVEQHIPLPTARWEFVPHITLGTIVPEAGILSDYPLSLTFPFESVNVMESITEQGNTVYKTLGSISLTS